jgi:hypothetical protein
MHDVFHAVVAAWECEHGEAASPEHLPALRKRGEQMLSEQGLPDSLFMPQLLQQWVDGAAVELPPVNAVSHASTESSIRKAVAGPQCCSQRVVTSSNLMDECVHQVLGGLASNELLTAVTGRGEPINNCVLYSLADGAARVERLD